MSPLAVAFLQIAVSLIITAIASRLMSPDGIKAKKLDSFTFPTVSSDRSIPVVFGDVLVEGPNVIWFGDYKSKADKEGGGLFTPTVTAGYKYSIGMELAISWGTLNSMTELWFGDNVAWVGSVTGTVTDQSDMNFNTSFFEVLAMDLFGGDKNGGGVRANCFFYPGSANQYSDNYMEDMLGKAYRHEGIAKVVWRGPKDHKKSGYIGEGNVVPPIKMRVQHYPNFLGSEHEKVLGTATPTANPAEVVYCLLIGRYANVNSTQPSVPVIPENLIDTASFLTTAETLYNEDMGISFQWQRDTPVKDIIDDIMNHVEGYLSEDTLTGKIRMVLNRADYDPETVPIFDESNIVDFTSYVRINPTVAVNRLTSTFTDPEQAFKSIPVMVEDLGNTFEQDMGAPGDIDLHMFHSGNVAILRTSRELIQLSEGIISGAFVANRSAYALNIGDPIKLSWDGFGVSELLVRVIEKTTGGLDDRAIEVKFVQDIFGIGTAVYGPPGGSNWIDIFNDPEDITDYEYFEQPYYLVDKFSTAGEEYLLFLMVNFPTSDTSGYEPWIQIDGGDYVNAYGAEISENDFTTLALDYGQEEGPSKDIAIGIAVIGEPPEDMISTVTFTNIQDSFRNWVLVGGELMAYESISDNGNGSWNLNTVYRGLLDTTPVDHSAGDKIWFLNSTFERLDRIFTPAEVVNIKTVTTTGKGVLDFANAAAKNITYVGRYDLPLIPGNIKIDSTYYPLSVKGDVLIEWSRRDRTVTSSLVKWDGADQTPEVGQTTTVKIYGGSGSLLHTETGIAGTNYTYTFAQELADAGVGQTYMTVEVFSVLGAAASHDTWSYSFDKEVGNQPVNADLDLVTTTSSSSADIDFDLDVPA